MFQLVLIEVMQADREREIQRAIRQRRLLRPPDDATEPIADTREATSGRALAIRVRPTGG